MIPLTQKDKEWVNINLITPSVDAIVDKLKPYVLTICILFFLLVTGMVSLLMHSFFVTRKVSY